MEMTKYQQQAANKWSFDFVNEAPIRTTKSQYAWDAVKINEAPKFYHHEFIAGPSTTPMQDDCENIWPLAAIRPTSSSCIANISSSPALIIHNSMVSHNRRMAHPVFAPASSSSSFSASTSSSLSNVCNKSQRKITGKHENYFSYIFHLPFLAFRRKWHKTLKVNHSQAVPRRQLILIKY